MAARDAYEGPAAAAAALLAMAGTAVAGLLLLDAGRMGRLDRLAAAVIAMAAGGSATVGAAPAGGPPIAVQGHIDAMPLGVSLVGALVLGALVLRRGRDGLLVRGASAAVTFTAGLGAVAWAARGTLTLPAGGAPAAVKTSVCSTGTGMPLGGHGSLGAVEAGFSVTVGRTVAGAAGWAIAVVGVCWLAGRFPAAAARLRPLWWVAGGIAAASLPAAWVFGGPAAAGGVLLALPLAVSGALLLGLGVPWTVHADGVLSCVLDGGWTLPRGGPLAVLSAGVMLGCGIAVAAGAAGGRPGGPLRRATGVAVRFAPAVGAVLAVLALLSRASVDVSARVFVLAVPLLDARLAANPLLALTAGLGAGAAAGFAGSLLVDAVRRRTIVGWRPCNGPDRR